MWSAFYGVSSTSRLLAQFSALVEPDSSIERIQSCFETVLQRALRRRAIVVSTRAAADAGDGPATAVAVWNPDRRSVGAHLAQLRLSDVANARLQEVFGPLGFAATPKIAAMVPVVSPRGTRIATVVIGCKRLLPLTNVSVRSLKPARRWRDSCSSEHGCERAYESPRHRRKPFGA
jgi:hypothetical protein